MLCDRKGTGIAFVLSQGQRHDSKLFQEVLDKGLDTVRPMGIVAPEKLAADKAYRASHILARLEKENIKAVIPQKSNAKVKQKFFDDLTYCGRNVVERLIGWLKQWRALATRYDKLARNYRATLVLALIERSLRNGP